MTRPRPRGPRAKPGVVADQATFRAGAPERRARVLKTLHLMNADGSVSADMQRKLKQVEHLLELLRPSIEAALESARTPVVWDLNCGSSYLGLLLLHHVREEFDRELLLAAADRDPARIDACRRRAADAGFPEAIFLNDSVAEADLPGNPALAISLHGCDTATDEALNRAVAAKTPHLAIIPCCQRELRGLLKRVPPHVAFLRDPAVAQEYGAMLTDVGRAAALRAIGYRTDVVEFVGVEHTLKNRLIRAEWTGRPDSTAAGELKAILAACTSPPAFAACGRA